MKINKFFIILLIVVAHIFLGLLANNITILATLHAIATLFVGLNYSIFAKKPQSVILISAYIVGAELLWRMTNANVFWEYGKYAVIFILAIQLLRKRHWKNSLLPILFFVMLIISIPATLFFYGLNNQAREAISFNLSGPLALSICVLYFSQLKINMEGLKKIAWAISLPIVSILTIASYSTLTATSISFTTESNFVASGGFGPNQISAILSLGAVLMFMTFVTEKDSRLKLLAIILFLAFLTQCVLTFSRGGLYNAAASLVLFSMHLVRTRKSRVWLILGIISIGLLGVLVIYPAINQFTNGMLAIRFSDTDLTHRGDIALGELMVWRDNPFLGVGPGVSAYANIKYIGVYSAAHTEYTRLLAEHGIFGLIAIILLVIMAIRAYFKAPTWFAKAWVTAFLVWPLVEMSHAAMRISAISFLLGLASVNWQSISKHNSSNAQINPINR